MTDSCKAPGAFQWTSAVDGQVHRVVPSFSAGMKIIEMILVVTGYAHEFSRDYAIILEQQAVDAEIKVHFLCLNPGVAFRDLRDQCRTVILTSGTPKLRQQNDGPFYTRDVYRHAVSDGVVLIRAGMRIPNSS